MNNRWNGSTTVTINYGGHTFTLPVATKSMDSVAIPFTPTIFKTSHVTIQTSRKNSSSVYYKATSRPFRYYARLTLVSNGGGSLVLQSELFDTEMQAIQDVVIKANECINSTSVVWREAMESLAQKLESGELEKDG